MQFVFRIRNDFECSFCKSPLIEDVTCRVLAGNCYLLVIRFAKTENVVAELINLLIYD